MKISADLRAFSDRLGHEFSRPELLVRALTHGSISTATRPDNQRLEFLGDRVLGLTVAEALFAREFADALPLIPHLRRDWEQHPPGLLGTLYLERWHLGGKAVLLGDAAHAMVPFHGQGMNCAFEDCVALAELLETHPDSARAFAAFEAERKPNAAAIQQMALDNYLEMRDRVADPAFLLQRELEQELQRRWPTRFVPHYTMVTFLHTPYALALERTRLQQRILAEATAGHASLAGIDWSALEKTIHAQLPVLEGAH